MADTVENSSIVLDGVATGMIAEAVKIQILAGNLAVGSVEQDGLITIAKDIRGMAALLSAIVKDLRTANDKHEK
jgi:hypothetical protein